MGEISPPSLLSNEHDIGRFNSGNDTLDEWLLRRALKNQASGASKTFVICENSNSVIGYYALATGSVERDATPGNFSRGMPDPILVIILGRLAIDRRYQSQKLGSFLLKDAMLRVLNISQHVGTRGLLVHAISEDAKRFYQKYGFVEAPFEPMTLLISTKTLSSYL